MCERARKIRVATKKNASKNTHAAAITLKLSRNSSFPRERSEKYQTFDKINTNCESIHMGFSENFYMEKFRGDFESNNEGKTASMVCFYFFTISSILILFYAKILRLQKQFVEDKKTLNAMNCLKNFINFPP